MAWIGGAIGALAGPVIGGLFGGSGSGSYMPSSTSGGQALYQPSGQPAIDQSLIGNMGKYGASIDRYFGPMLAPAESTFYSQYNNPYASGLQSYANQAGQLSAAMAPQYYGQMQNLGAAGNQLLQTGFDPQSALYDRMQQQNMEQANAGLSQRGLAMSPYGAGVANQANQNFNIDWQNQQLQRQLQATQGAAGAYAGALPMGAAAINATTGAGQLPYTAFGTIGQGQNQALQNYYGNISPYFGAIGNLMNQQANYLGWGQGASSQALSAQDMANKLSAQNAAGLSSGITSAIKAVPSSVWSNLFGSGGTNSSTGYNYAPLDWGSIG